MAIIPRDEQGNERYDWMPEQDRWDAINQRNGQAPPAPSYGRDSRDSGGGGQAPAAPSAASLRPGDNPWGIISAWDGSTGNDIGDSSGLPQRAPRDREASAASGQPSGTVWGVNPMTGVGGWYTPEQLAAMREDQNKAAEAKRLQQELENRQKQQLIDIELAKQAGQEAYNKAMIQYNNAQLAQAAADAAMRNNIAMQNAEIARAGQSSQANYQQGMLAQQTLAAQQARRQRRPYRPLRVSVA